VNAEADNQPSAAPGPFGRLWAMVRGAVAFATRPLTLAQALSSASGVLGVLLSAVFLPRSAFADFVLLNMVGNVMSGFGMAAMFVPALIQQRLDPASFVRASSLACLAVATSLGTLAACLALGFSPVESGLVGACIVAQPLYAWLRYRAIGQDQRWLVVGSDALRLTTVLATPVLKFLHDDAVTFQAYLFVGLLLPTTALAIWGRRPSASAPYARYAASAGWQVGDYVAGQFILTIPLLVIGSGAAGGTVAGIRVAQSLLGPLNLLTAASWANLVADASTRPSLASVEGLIRTGSRAARALAVAAVAYVSLLIASVLATSVELRGVDNRSLLFGLVIVGAYSIMFAWSVMESVVIRLLGHQALVTAGRVLIACCAVAGFGVGYQFSGPQVSIAAGFLVAGAMSMGTFTLMSRSVYRRERASAAGA